MGLLQLCSAVTEDLSWLPTSAVLDENGVLLLSESAEVTAQWYQHFVGVLMSPAGFLLIVLIGYLPWILMILLLN